MHALTIERVNQSDPNNIPAEVLDQTLDQIMAIEQQAYPIPWSRQQFVDCLKAGYQLHTACQANGELIGYWMIQIILDELHLLNICVTPDLQGNGYGKKLLSVVLEQARDLSCYRILLEVRRNNKAARKLYQSQGFDTIGTRKGYYPDVDGNRMDAIVMEYLLD